MEKKRAKELKLKKEILELEVKKLNLEIELEKLRHREYWQPTIITTKEEETNWKEMTPEESQRFKDFFLIYGLWDLVEDTSADGEGVGNELQFTIKGERVVEAVKDLFFQEKEMAYREGFEDGLQKANEDEQYIKYRK